MVGFESIFEKRLCLGKLCNGSRFVRTYTKCWTFENILCFEKYVFFKCLVFVLKMSKDVCFENEQATKNISTYSKSLCSSPPPLDVFILPLIGKKLYLWM